jgi:hypothetical protein
LSGLLLRSREITEGSGEAQIWTGVQPSTARYGGYTTAAAELRAAVDELLAAAVAADRAAGAPWEEIGAALEVDASTARRTYR